MEISATFFEISSYTYRIGINVFLRSLRRYTRIFSTDFNYNLYNKYKIQSTIELSKPSHINPNYQRPTCDTNRIYIPMFTTLTKPAPLQAPTFHSKNNTTLFTYSAQNILTVRQHNNSFRRKKKSHSIRFNQHRDPLSTLNIYITY